MSSRMGPGLLAAVAICSIYGGLALSVNYPKAADEGFWSDEATYYLMAHSLASDGDLTYRRDDLVRAYREFSKDGPTGLFLKRGRHVTGIGLTTRAPFVDIRSVPDPRTDRLFFGKSFIYPVFAAPFVWLFGTNGFLLFNTLLLATAFLAAYAFVSARSGPVIGLVFAGAFIFATAVPVYVVWMMPELFNFTLGLVALFLWLYKYVATDTPARGWAWLRGPKAEWLAAVLLGVATFSKITNAILAVAMVAWWLWRREWRRAIGIGALWATVTVGLFGVNVAVTGDWNYQGSVERGDRATCYGPFPFQQAGVGLDACADRGRDETLTSVMFDRQVFWSNLRANVWYFFVGRNAGLVPYFSPGVLAMIALLVRRKASEPWQWFVLGAVLAHIGFFIVTQPYTYFGGGAIGDRYFMGVYGACLFLLPPIRSLWAGGLSWIVGGLFVGQSILNPFHASHFPAAHTKSGLIRIFPTELTNTNDLPIDSESDRIRIWYGDNDDPGAPAPSPPSPKFQAYYLDDNSYLRELDRSFWIRGESRAEVLLKTVRPYRQLELTLTAGAVATEATVRVGGHAQTVQLGVHESRVIRFDLGPGFPYKKDRPEPAYEWVLSVSSSAGFTPLLDPQSTGVADRRFLGINIKPVMIP